MRPDDPKHYHAVQIINNMPPVFPGANFMDLSFARYRMFPIVYGQQL